MRSLIIILTVTTHLIFISCSNKHGNGEGEIMPNIVLIYLDDLGYGDVGAYGVTELKTPNIDRLAMGGIILTNGHASSATCSPSRYALLTGTYPWRNERARILSGTAPLLIDTAQITLPKMLHERGYQTGIVGKWHLGLGDGNVDWNTLISPGPNEVGFDYSYIMAATQDRVPTVYIENGMVVGLDPDDPIEISYEKNFPGEPTGLDNPELLKMKWHHGHNNSIVNGIPRIGFMKGGENAKWVDEDMADNFLAKAQEYIMEHKNEPFFLYVPHSMAHVPLGVSEKFKGKSEQGMYGDVIMEIDWSVGEILKTLEENDLDNNTLVIFATDNGPCDDVGMTVEVLGAAVERQVKTVIDGTKVDRAGKGVVDHRHQFVLFGERDDRLEIADLDQRVRYRLDIDHLGVGFELGWPRTGVAGVDKIVFDSEPGNIIGDKAVGAAVERALYEQVITRREQRQQCAGDRRHAARRDECALRVLDSGNFGVENRVVWGVIQSNVFDIMVPFATIRFEHCRLKNRGGHRTFVPGMLARVYEFGVDAFERFGHRATPLSCGVMGDGFALSVRFNGSRTFNPLPV